LEAPFTYLSLAELTILRHITRLDQLILS